MFEEKHIQKGRRVFVVSRASFIYFSFILFTGIVGFLVIHYIINSSSDGYKALVSCSIIAVLIMVVQYIALSKLSGGFTSNYLIFLISFIVFHFGQFFVYALGVNYNFFYLKSYDIKIILSTLLFEYLCVEMLFLAGSNVTKIQPIIFSSINRVDSFSICKISSFFMVVTGLVAYSLLGFKVVAFMQGYYESVREFESNIPSIIGLFEYFFIPFSILTWIYSEDRKLNRLVKCAIIAWSVVTALCGDRTSGIAGIIMVVLVESRFKSNQNMEKYFLSFFILVGAIFLSVFIKSFREGFTFTTSGIMTILAEFLGELGGSFFPVTLIMRICPSSYPYLMGKSYLFSLLAGFLPASIDFTGTVDKWVDYAMEPVVYWIKSEYDYTFGTGYSLCAEAYANFGWFGFLIIFIIALIIMKFLSYDDNNKFSKYSSSMLMFEFFTLPRRNSYYIFNHFLYCVIIISIILLLFAKSKGKEEF